MNSVHSQMVPVRAPAHWKPVRLKFLIDMFGGGTPSKSDPGYWAGDIPWVSPKDMKRTTVHDTEDHISAAALVETATRRVEAGSVLVVVRSGILQHTLPVAINTVAVALNQDMKALRCRAALRPRYLFYVLSGLQSDLLMTWRMLGATVDSIDVERMRNTVLWVPPEQEQLRIIRYLDRATAQIDTLIAAKRRLVDLLEERRTVLLVEALSPQVPPSHWRRTRLKFIFESAQAGAWGIDADGGVDDVSCVRVADFDRTHFVVADEVPTLRSVAAADRIPRLLRRGDVLVEKSGGGESQPVGFAVAFDLPLVAICSNFITRLRPARGVDRRYAAMAMAAAYRDGRNVPFVKQTTGIQNLDLSAYLGLPWALPPTDEQGMLASRLASEFSRIDRIRSTVERELDLLKERRQALITAAVTGELEIPEVAA